MRDHDLDSLPDFAKVPDVARVLGMSAAQAWRLVWANDLPSVRLSEKIVRVPKKELERWIKNRPSAGAA